MNVLTLLLTATLLAPAQDGGKMPWKGKDPKAAMVESAGQGRPMLLYFTGDIAPGSKELGAGAFSNPEVLSAAERVTCIFVDCSGKKNADLAAQYRVPGFPTLVFCDPQGKPTVMMQGGEAAVVAREIRALADKFKSVAEGDLPAAAPKLSAMSLGVSLKEARRQSRPLVLYFYDDSPPSQSVTQALTDPGVQKLLARCVLGAGGFQKEGEDCVRFGVTRAPTLLVLDGTKAKPEEKPLARIEGSRSSRELIRELEAALAVAPAPTAPVGGPGAEPTPPAAPAEKLSDDEIDRKFIQARLSVAMEALKKDRKKDALAILEDIVKSYPNHVDTVPIKKLLEGLKKP